MPTKSVRAYTLALVLSDILSFLAAFTVAYILRVQVDTRPLLNPIPALDFLSSFFVLLPFWLVILAALGLYSPRVYTKRLKEIGKLVIGSFISILLVIGFSFVINKPLFPARLVPIYAFFMTFLFLVIGRELLGLIRKLAFRFKRGVQRVMIVGTGQSALDIYSSIADTRTSGFDVVASLGFNPSSSTKGGEFNHFRNQDKAMASLKDLDIDTIIHVNPIGDGLADQKIFEAAITNHVSYSFMPSEVEFYSGRNSIGLINGYPIISVSQTPLAGWGELVKRLVDIISSLIGLIFSAPIIGVAGLVIRMTDPGPIIYKHQRISKHGKKFYVYKLRSMYMKYSTGKYGSGKSDEQVFREMGREDLVAEFKIDQKVEKDPRVMPIGIFLRKSSIDELPQLWNVLKGDLSLVGPRPIVPDELKRYKKDGSLFLSIKPGLTGLWQVSGRNDIDYPERVRLDIYYIQNWSLWLDFKIIIQTIKSVLRGSGQ